MALLLSAPIKKQIVFLIDLNSFPNPYIRNSSNNNKQKNNKNDVQPQQQQDVNGDGGGVRNNNNETSSTIITTSLQPPDSMMMMIMNDEIIYPTIVESSSLTLLNNTELTTVMSQEGTIQVEPSYSSSTTSINNNNNNVLSPKTNNNNSPGESESDNENDEVRVKNEEESKEDSAASIILAENIAWLKELILQHLISLSRFTNQLCPQNIAWNYQFFDSSRQVPLNIKINPKKFLNFDLVAFETFEELLETELRGFIDHKKKEERIRHRSKTEKYDENSENDNCNRLTCLSNALKNILTDIPWDNNYNSSSGGGEKTECDNSVFILHHLPSNKKELYEFSISKGPNAKVLRDALLPPAFFKVWRDQYKIKMNFIDITSIFDNNIKEDVEAIAVEEEEDEDELKSVLVIQKLLQLFNAKNETKASRTQVPPQLGSWHSDYLKSALQLRCMESLLSLAVPGNRAPGPSISGGVTNYMMEIPPYQLKKNIKDNNNSGGLKRKNDCLASASVVSFKQMTQVSSRKKVGDWLQNGLGDESSGPPIPIPMPSTTTIGQEGRFPYQDLNFNYSEQEDGRKYERNYVQESPQQRKSPDGRGRGESGSLVPSTGHGGPRLYPLYSSSPTIRGPTQYPDDTEHLKYLEGRRSRSNRDGGGGIGNKSLGVSDRSNNYQHQQLCFPGPSGATSGTMGREEKKPKAPPNTSFINMQNPKKPILVLKAKLESSKVAASAIATGAAYDGASKYQKSSGQYCAITPDYNINNNIANQQQRSSPSRVRRNLFSVDHRHPTINQYLAEATTSKHTRSSSTSAGGLDGDKKPSSSSYSPAMDQVVSVFDHQDRTLKSKPELEMNDVEDSGGGEQEPCTSSTFRFQSQAYQSQQDNVVNQSQGKEPEIGEVPQSPPTEDSSAVMVNPVSQRRSRSCRKAYRKDQGFKKAETKKGKEADDVASGRTAGMVDEVVQSVSQELAGLEVKEGLQQPRESRPSIKVLISRRRSRSMTRKSPDITLGHKF